jgi:hypothetical protein
VLAWRLREVKGLRSDDGDLAKVVHRKLAGRLNPPVPVPVVPSPPGFIPEPPMLGLVGVPVPGRWVTPPVRVPR